MATSRGPSEGSSTTLYALVIFVVLFLTAAVFAVVMYIKNEQCLSNQEAAEDALAAIASSAELRTIKPLVEKKGDRVSKTAVSRIKADMRYMAEKIAGPSLGDIPLTGMAVAVEEKTNEQWWKKAQNALYEPKEGDPSVGLAGIVDALVSERDRLVKLLEDTQKETENANKLSEQRIKTLEDNVKELEKNLKVARESALANEKMYKQLEEEQRTKLQDIIKRRENDISKLQTEKENLTKTYQQLQDRTAQVEAKMLELQNILRDVRSTPTEVAALAADGKIVEVVPESKLAYIDLGRKNHIYRGLTFAVYDSFQTIPKNGKGKGSLEVIEIMDTISKCRITKFDSTNPILKDDIIANLIWARDKAYLFCVGGDFDFDGDNQIDQDGFARVESLIKSWGGKVTYQLSVDVDFLVLGKKPVAPAKPAEDFLNSNTKEAVVYRKSKDKADNYAQMIELNKALGIPTFNLSRFLRFIGYYEENPL